MAKAAKNPQVEAAKISAFQAIVVALITTLGGTVGGYFFGSAGSPKHEAHQNWLTVENVEYSGSLRLVITVNGNNFSYPSDKIWAGDGEQNHKEKFPLPIGSEEYHVTFTALVRDADPSWGGVYSTKLSQKEEDISLDQLPTGPRTISSIPSASASLVVKPMLEISYSIE